MAEWEEWLDADSLVVSISDVQPFAIYDLQVLTRPVMVCWVVFESLWERRLQLLLASLVAGKEIVCSYG